MTADTSTVAFVDETASKTTGVLDRTASPARPALSQRGAWPTTKRAADLLLAIVLLVAVAPILVIIAAAIKLDSPGPVLFRQRRYGRDMRQFAVLKFRTMVDGASPELHRQYIAQLAATDGEDDGLKKLVADPRVTRVGAFLRRTSLDELPQLLNIVAGQMSLVGPRPALDYELEHYDHTHYVRFSVRPGLTGLWQVSGRNALGFNAMLDLDATYARESGPAMDLQILARTPITLLRGQAA